MAKKAKTNAIRKLDALKIKYEEHEADVDGTKTGVEVSIALGQNPDKCFKTLVTVGKTGEHYVFMVPVAEELDLKKAAAAVGEKSVEMVKSKELLGLTGYIHGGCSPIGMKKFFKTTCHISAKNFDTICYSGGRIGLQLETTPEDLGKVIDYQFADIIRQ